MKKFIILFWPIIFIFGLWFIFASPYFIKGKVPYASTYQVNFFPPWSYYEKFWGPVKNNAMPDIHGQIYPWKKFTIETFKNGQIPFWNPYNFSGNPHLANYQSAVLSPFNLLFFVLPFIDAWSMLILLQPLLAGLFMYLLMRSYKVSEFAALLSSISFMFCGFIVVWMAYGTLSMAIAFLPLALFATEKYLQTKKLKFLFLLSMVIPLSFFSGHFQMSLYFLLTVVLYGIYKGINAKNLPFTIYHLSFVFLGLLLSLLQIIPSIRFYFESVRSEIFISGGGIPFYYLVTSFAPDFFGNPVTRNDWFGYYAEWSSFIGIIPFILTIFAIITRKTASVLFFLLLGMVALILSVDSAVQQIIGSLKIPALSTSIPTRIIVLFSLSVSILAGFGLDVVKELIVKKSTKRIMAPFIGVGTLLIVVWILLFVFKIVPDDRIMQAKRNLVLPTMLFGVIMAGTLTALFYRKLIFCALGVLILAISFDSLRFAQKWMPFDPKELVFQQVPIIDAIKRNIGDGRIFGNIGAELSTYYGFPSIEGYDPLYIARYGQFIQSSGTGNFVEGERSVVKIARSGKYINRVLDLLGVSLIFHPIADTNQGWAFPVWEDSDRFTPIYRDEKFQLFKNNLAMSRATLFYSAEVIEDSKKIIKRFYSDDFDFRKVVILEEQPDVVLKEGTGSARIISYTPNKIAIKVITDTPALLFLSDNFYPGWKAMVNGKETKIYRAHYTFRAIVVPRGESLVGFGY